MAANTTSRAPRVRPSPDSMAARAQAAPEIRRSFTQAQEFALLYARYNQLNQDTDQAGFRREVPGLRETELALWPAVQAAAQTVLRQVPETQADLLLQMTIAAGWMETVTDAAGDDTFSAKMGSAIGEMLNQSALFLRESMPITCLSPEIDQVVRTFLAMAGLSDPLTERLAA